MVHDAVREHTGKDVEELPEESSVGRSARSALSAVARAAMHHTLGRTDQAHQQLGVASKHVQNLLTTIKGEKLNAGQPVSAAPDTRMAEAADHVTDYEKSIKGDSVQQAVEAGHDTASAQNRSLRISNRKKLI